MARTRIELNDAGMEQLLRDQGVVAFMTARAQNVLAAAQADDHDDTTDRAVVRVVSGDWKGHIMEANYGILSRALDHA